MPKSTRQAGSQIVVDLGGVKLPADVEKQLESDIRGAVLSTLGKLDLRRNITVISRPKFPPGTIGIILRPAEVE